MCAKKVLRRDFWREKKYCGAKNLLRRDFWREKSILRGGGHLKRAKNYNFLRALNARRRAKYFFRAKNRAAINF